MQKYLEYLSFLRWPRGFLTSWQLENSIFFPQNSRLEHEQSLGWGWKLILNRQILVFLPYRADPNFPHHQGKFRLFKLRKEGEKSPKLAFPACQFPGISKQQHYNKHGTDFFNSCPRFRVEFWPKNSSSSLFFLEYFFFWENRAGTRTKETNPMPRMLRNTQQKNSSTTSRPPDKKPPEQEKKTFSPPFPTFPS